MTPQYYSQPVMGQPADTTRATWTEYSVATRQELSQLLDRATTVRSRLSTHRQSELLAELHSTRHRLLNIPWFVTQRDRFTLEQRVLDLEEKLHDERVRLWRDLLPLADRQLDAKQDAYRVQWLTAFVDRIGGDDA